MVTIIKEGCPINWKNIHAAQNFILDNLSHYSIEYALKPHLCILVLPVLDRWVGFRILGSSSEDRTCSYSSHPFVCFGSATFIQRIFSTYFQTWIAPLITFVTNPYLNFHRSTTIGHLCYLSHLIKSNFDIWHCRHR